VKLAVGAVLVLAALSSLPIIFLSLVIIAKGGFYGNTFDVFTTAHTPMDAVFHGILFAVTLFIGFEAAASIAEESRSPRTAIPVAVLATIAISAAFFILVTYAVSIGYGLAAINKGAWANSASPLDDMATKYVGSWLGAIIDISIILDMLSLSIAIMVTCARLLRAGARRAAAGLDGPHHRPRHAAGRQPDRRGLVADLAGVGGAAGL